MMISVLWSVSSVLPKSQPIIGILYRNGMPDLLLLCILPDEPADDDRLAVLNDEVRRRLGLVEEELFAAAKSVIVSKVEISCEMSSATSPPSLIRGLTFRMMPISLY